MATESRPHPAEKARTVVLAASVAGVVGLTGGFAAEAAFSHAATNTTNTTKTTGTSTNTGVAAPDNGTDGSSTQSPFSNFGRNAGAGSAVPSAPSGGFANTRSGGS